MQKQPIAFHTNCSIGSLVWPIAIVWACDRIRYATRCAALGQRVFLFFRGLGIHLKTGLRPDGARLDFLHATVTNDVKLETVASHPRDRDGL